MRILLRRQRAGTGTSPQLDIRRGPSATRLVEPAQCHPAQAHLSVERGRTLRLGDNGSV